MAGERWSWKGERELIASIRKLALRRGRTHNRALKLGIGDDCAVLRPSPNQELVVTTDLLLEQVHFRRDWHPPESAGHRCLARGLSDLAAMGARPVAALLSLAIPADLRGRWLERFFDGWMRLAERYRVPLAGGDMAESPSCASFSQMDSGISGLFVADIILLGSVPRGKALLRSTARSGDILYVTGKLGGAAAELRALRRRPAAFLKKIKVAPSHPHLYPEPRLGPGRELLDKHLATAAMDLSDGLSTDLARLCESSGLSAVLDVKALPLARGATLEDALNGGEDYELLFTARPKTAMPAKLDGIPVHVIGKMAKRASSSGGSVELITANGKRSALAPAGWEYFGS